MPSFVNIQFSRLFFILSFLLLQIALASPTQAIDCIDPFDTKLISTDSRASEPMIGCETNLPPGTPNWIQVPATDEDGTFTVSWAASINANYYELEQKAITQSAYVKISFPIGLTFTTNELADNIYNYRVRACNFMGGCSSYRTSGEVVVKRPVKQPPPSGGTTDRDLISDSVGAVAGSFRVDEGGQANYSIPIFSPKGVAGVSPSVNLSYNSGSGNGIMGVGWQLSAAGGIGRCGQSVAVDGKHGSVNFDSDDRFCLNGQRLVVVSGEYGANASEYRTVIDSQTKVVSYGTQGSGPSYFMVWHKDGSINAYGSTSNSRFRINNDGVVQSDVLTWAQTYSEDRFGNRIEYFYQLDEANGENRIDSIEYGPNVNIQFEFTTGRPDYHLGYLYGGKTQLKDRLDSIIVTDANVEVRRYDIDYEISSNQLSRLTSITESKDGVSLQPTIFHWLNKTKGIQADINEVNDGLRMQQGTFANLNGDLEPDWVYVASSAETLVDPNTGAPTFSNGIIATRMQSHFFTGEEYERGCEAYVEGDIYGGRNYEIYDINGDGRDEVLATTEDEVIAVFFDENGCLESWNDRSIKITDIDTGNKDKWFFGDVNGDARPDILYKRNGNRYMRLAMADGTTTGIYYSAEIPLNFIVTSFSNGTNAIDQQHTSYADFNGDGRIDLLTKVTNTVFDPDGYCTGQSEIVTKKWIVMISEGDGNFKEYASTGNLGLDVTKDKDLRLVDLNMDGLPDLVYRERSDDRWHYKIFTGNKFLPSKTLYVDNDHPIFFGDHDQDGLMEVMFIESTRLKYREFNRLGALGTLVINTGVHAERSQLMAQIDINGDGELDIYSVVEDAHTTYTHYEQHVSYNKTPFATRDRVNQIDNGLGNITNVIYKSLTDPAFPDLYDDDNGNHKGWYTDNDKNVVFNQRAPSFVVQHVESSSPAFDNINNTNSIEYRYGKLRSHSVYGNLGFEWLETIDEQTDMITRTVYKQEYPFIGRSESSQVWYGNRSSTRLISSAVSEYDSKIVGSYNKWDEELNTYVTADIQYPYLLRNTEDNYDFNVGTLSQQQMVSRKILVSEYNDYGFPIKQNAYTCYGHNPNCETSGWLKRVKTTNTYLPADKTNWILGRLERTVAQHYADGQSTITRTSDFEYDNQTGILKAEIVDPDSTSRTKYLRTEYQHDSYGNVKRKTVCDNVADCTSVPISDPHSLYHVFRTSETQYDLDGRYVTKTLNGYNQVVSEVIERNELGLPTKVKDITGNETESIYGTFGSDYYTLSPTGNWTKQIKRLCSDTAISCPTTAHIRVESTSADGSLSYAYSDALGRVVKTEQQGFGDYFIVTESAYDNQARLWYKTLPYKSNNANSIQKTYSYYDILNRISRLVYPDGSEDSRYYDGYVASELAVKTRSVNAKNQVKTEYKNAAGELVKVTDNNNKSLTYSYNATGDLLTVHFDDVKQSEIQYDSHGRKIKMWDWDKGAQNGNLYWQYTYNALGELVYQKDAKGQQIRIYRDRSGRKIRQLDRNSSLVYTADFRWTYDNSSVVSGSTGKVTQRRDNYDSDLVVDYEYDVFGRNDATLIQIAGKDFVTNTIFDSIGRVYESYDPSGGDHGLRYSYNSYGYLNNIKETKDGVSAIYRTISEMDEFGNVTREVFGNGVVTEREYEPTTGRLIRINTTDGAAVRQNLEYVWDNIGRLQERTSITKNLTEIFGYDNLNRVKTVNGVNKFNYDAKGNITWKHDVGSYTYGETCNGVVAGSHAASKAGGKSYCYDLNGNMVSGDGRSIEYSIFDKATKITKGGHTTEFSYSPERARYKRVDTSGAGVTTTFYLGSVEYIQKPDGSTFYRRNIPGAVIEVPATGAMKASYLHTDHLGSTDVITSNTGATAQETSFDVFGKKRSVSNWVGEILTPTFGPLALTSKSYTGHEAADEVGVIHMNGRIYDPHLGRFMQADPFIDGATDSQGYNRYTYVRNNPLAYSDPTGFKRSGGLKNLGKLARLSMGLLGLHKTGRQIWQAVAPVFCGPYYAACAAGAASVGSLAEGGNLKSSAVTGAKAYATAYISAKVSGSIGDGMGALDTSSKVLKASFAHGVLGGVISELNGGKFGHGFASSFMSKYIGTELDLFENIPGDDFSARASRTMIAGLIGGTISEATGGKFANGAVQSAVQWAYNAESVFKKIGLLSEASNHYRSVRDEISGLDLTKLEDRGRLVEIEQELGFRKKEILTARDLVKEIARVNYLVHSRYASEDLRITLNRQIFDVDMRLMNALIKDVGREAMVAAYHPKNAIGPGIGAMRPKLGFGVELGQQALSFFNIVKPNDKGIEWLHNVIHGEK